MGVETAANTTPLEQLLDEAERSLWRSETRDEAFSRFLADLSSYRRSDPDTWPDAIAQCRKHDLFHFFHADPYTRRAFRKPRGYAGDAVMLDFVYLGEPGPVDEVGRAAFAITNASTMSESTRNRRDTFANLIDEVAAERDRPRIASIAAGHLREAEMSTAVKQGAIEELVAFDFDDLSLAVVERDYRGRRVATHKGEIADLMRGRLDLGSFDFVYSAGLFDYLSEPVAQRLMATLFSMLRPGGRLTVANFASGCDGDAYLEAFMDWFLVYRTLDELSSLLQRIPNSEHVEYRRWLDPSKNVAYLDLSADWVGAT